MPPPPICPQNFAGLREKWLSTQEVADAVKPSQMEAEVTAGRCLTPREEAKEAGMAEKQGFFGCDLWYLGH